MNPDDQIIRINRDLEFFYSGKLPLWKDLRAKFDREGRILSIPLFLRASAAYLSAKPRLVIVGQETHGWWTEYQGNASGVETSQIMNFYEEAWTSLFNKYKSPYWQAMRAITRALGVADPPLSFLFSNLFPCDLDRKRSPDETLEALRKWKILPGELRLLDPDYVIFFCGPGYCYNLEYYFGDKSPRERLSRRSPLYPYQPKDWRWKGLVTYHPAELRRSRNWSTVLNGIVDWIKSDMAGANDGEPL